jgi:hypothetical protein
MEIDNMTAATWSRMTPAQREAVRDYSGLTSQLKNFEGWRVEVVDHELVGGATRRFIVGMSTGWKPCHLEILTRRSHGGFPAAKSYQSVRKLYKAR